MHMKVSPTVWKMDLSCIMLILVSLNAVHRFQLHGNGIHFRLNGTERNGNVTVFMPPTVNLDFSMNPSNTAQTSQYASSMSHEIFD